MLSVFGGMLGLDRFYIGDYLFGFLKVVTCGGLGIWWLFDVIYMGRGTKLENSLNYLEYLNPALVNRQSTASRAKRLGSISLDIGSTVKKGVDDIMDGFTINH